MFNHYSSLENFKSNHKKKIVVFTTCNLGGLSLAKNLAISCWKKGVELVFFGNDEASIKQMSNYSTTVNNTKDNRFRLDVTRDLPTYHTKFNTEGFIRTAWMRYEIIKFLTWNNYYSIYLDTDIVVEKDFAEDVISYLENSHSDGVVQLNHNMRPCTGILGFHPRSKYKLSRIYSETYLRKMNYKTISGGADQSFFNDHVCPYDDNPKLNMQFLPRDLYPNGAWWYQNNKILKNVAKLIHYNCVIGQNNKISKMKQFNHYYL